MNIWRKLGKMIQRRDLLGDPVILPCAEVIGDYETMTDKDWHALRTQGIGGSEAGAVLGMDPYKSSLMVCLYKTGRVPSPDLSDNEAVQMGSILEPLIRQHLCKPYIEKHAGRSVEVVAPRHTYRSINHPHMICNPDGFLRLGDMTVGLEIKTGNAYQLPKWGGSEGRDIPDTYYAQVQHYLAVSGLSQWWIMGLIGNRRLLRIVSRNENFIEHLINQEGIIWSKIKDNILDNFPAPTGTDYETEAIYKMGEPRGEDIADLISVDLCMSDYKAFGDQIKSLEASKEAKKQEIILQMGNASSGRGALYRAKLAGIKSSRLDVTRLRAERPDVAQEYTRSSEYTRFTVDLINQKKEKK